MTELTQLPPFSTLIAPSYLHPMIRSTITSNASGCIGLRIYSLTSYLFSLSNKDTPEDIDLLFSYQRHIQAILSQLKTYQSIATTPAFLKECHSFIETMKFYEITPEQLPTTTQAELEIKCMIEQLYPLSTSMDILTSVQKTLPTLTNVYLYDSFQTHQEHVMMAHLIEKGAILLPLPSHTCTTSFYHAINMRQEIEACAQKIILDDVNADDCVITLANPSYQPIVEQVFQRYHIPYTLLHSSSKSIITQRCYHLISYALTKDMQDLLACMDAGLFACEQLDSFREYVELFQTPLDKPFDHLQSIQATGHILDALEVEKLKELEQRAEVARLLIYPEAQRLFIEDPKKLIEELLSIVKTSMQHPSIDELQVVTNIQSLFASCYHQLETIEDIAFLQPFVEDVAITHSVRELKGALICNLTQLIPDRSIQFLLGATQKNYPGYKAKNGIFDETYWRKTALPSMENRFDHYMKQCDKLLHVNPTLIVSYPLGTYEGKGNEAALEIEEEMNCSSQPYPLIENYERIERSYCMDETYARRLFVRNDQIKGSISAIERYVHCPYSYFLRYGLSLREPMEHGFSTSYMGTLSHLVLELLVEQYGKGYTKASVERIQEIVDTEVAAIQAVFPNNAALMNSISRRFMDSFLQTLQRLDDFETHSACKPFLREYEFAQDFPIDEQTSFALKGYIDRIDACGNFNCILDYKSSAKTLSEDRVFAALQLQLLTYSIVTKQAFGKDILGAYYISLKNENIPYIAGKMKRRPVEFIESDKEVYEDAVGKVHRFNGWTMRKDIDMLDDTGNHIVGVSCNKDGVVKARKYYQFTTVQAHMETMYRMIGKRMLQGDITCSPDADACMFCSYQSICRFKGFPSERKPLIEVDDTLYWEGGEVDADME